MDNSQKKRRQPHIYAVILLFLLMGAAFFLSSQRISAYATESCYHMLHQYTLQLSRELRKNVEGTQKILAMTASQIAGSASLDSPEVRRYLDSFQGGALVSRLELLLPGDRVLQTDGTIVDASGILSFQKEAALGVHVSSRETELQDPEREILRNYVPVMQGGNTVAMLYGVMDLAQIADFYASDLLSDGIRIHLIEGNSGDFLLNTVHDELGNIKGLRNRQPKPGYTVEEVMEDMANLQSGRTAFLSHTFGDYFYCDYAPVGIRDWMAMVTISESLALADAHQIRMTLYLLAGVEAALLIAYFLWLLSRTKRDAAEKESQLNRVQYMLNIENTLFGAARNPALFERALQQVSETLHAHGSFFLMQNPLQETQAFFYHPEWDDQMRAEITDCFFAVSQRMRSEKGIVCYNPASLLQEGSAAYDLAQKYSVNSFLLLPVPDRQGKIIGALGAVNLHRRWKDTALLESVILSFLTALNHLESFRMVQEMGTMDHLTGLLNRNSFQQATEELEQNPDNSLSCVYVDVDGLHEFNNQCGHMSGDRMLQSVAAALKTSFGVEHTYRIGGDEFVIFTFGLDEKDVKDKVRETEQTVAACGYHISTGVEFRRNIPLLYALIRQAESNMYAAKRRYYEEINESDLPRERNLQLEALLTEKQDLDAFRSVLASQYKGVYVVNLSLDVMRPIYIPSYFADLIEETGGKFSSALQQYVAEAVQPEYRDVLSAFMDYTQVKSWLEQGETPALQYQKLDGSSVMLQIYPSPKYAPQRKESIWVFGDLDAST